MSDDSPSSAPFEFRIQPSWRRTRREGLKAGSGSNITSEASRLARIVTRKHSRHSLVLGLYVVSLWSPPSALLQRSMCDRGLEGEGEGEDGFKRSVVPNGLAELAMQHSQLLVIPREDCKSGREPNLESSNRCQPTPPNTWLSDTPEQAPIAPLHSLHQQNRQQELASSLSPPSPPTTEAPWSVFCR